MKTIFLTSSLENIIRTENGRVAKKCDNSNFFVDRVRAHISKINTLVFFASSPDDYEKNDMFSTITQQSLNLDGFGIENLIVVDHRFNGDLEKTIMSADVLFLTGGHVPTENTFFHQIGLKDIIAKYDGIIIGQSAGSMNCAKTVYAPPESPEEITPEYSSILPGLGLTNIRIMPHMAFCYDDNVDGKGKSTYDFCIEDSYDYPVYGIYDTGFVEISDGKAIAYGKTLLIKNGECHELCVDKENVEISETYCQVENLEK